MKNIVKTLFIPLILPALIVEWIVFPKSFFEVLEDYYE